MLGLVGCASSFQPAAVAAPSPRLALAYAYFQNAQYRVALEESHKVLALQPEDAQALTLQGLIYGRLNEPALAQRSFTQAEKMAPLDADIAHNHGVFLCQQAQYPDAAQRFARALQQPLYSEKAKTLWVWGRCAQGAGEEARAQALWTQSLALTPNADAALALAGSLQAQSQPLQAAAVLQRINQTDAASAETLWQGIVLARQNAQSDAVQRYAAQLKQRFSTSSQWDAFQREVNHD